MANNCLVTKLNGVVNNNTLEVLGTMIIGAKTDSRGKIYISASTGKTCILTAMGTVTITSVSGAGAQLIDSKNARLCSSSNDDEGTITFSKSSAYIQVKISNKYNLRRIRTADIEGSSKYIDYLVNLKWLETEIWTPTSLSKFKTFENLEHFMANSVNLQGELSDIGCLIHLTYMSFYNGKVSGSIEDFVSEQRSFGRTTCSGITCVFGNTQIKFNGSTISGSTGKTLSWTADTITFDGTTISA